MTATGTISKGYSLKDASGNAIAHITALGEFGGVHNDVNVTATDSVGSWEEYIPGLIEGGEFTATCVFSTSDTSGQLQAITDCLSGSTQNYTITMATGSTWVAPMYVKSHKFLNTNLKDAIKLNLVFKVAGAPTFTA